MKPSSAIPSGEDRVAKRAIFAVEGPAVYQQLKGCRRKAGPSTRELIAFAINSLGRDDKIWKLGRDDKISDLVGMTTCEP